MENGMEGRACAWVLGHPGCFSYGADCASALVTVPAAIQDYIGWIQAHGQSWLSSEPFEISLVETWDVYDVNDAYERVEQGNITVNAWFQHDWKPLTAEDVERGLLLLKWSRSDLLQVIENLDQARLDLILPGERWSTAGILKHVGGAEWWYLDQLGLAVARESVPDGPFERLDFVRSRLVEVLPELADSSQVVGKYGEIWSPRKLLRRAAWHERDHTEHIRKLVFRV
jgi:hypothetical protein